MPDGDGTDGDGVPATRLATATASNSDSTTFVEQAIIHDCLPSSTKKAVLSCVSAHPGPRPANPRIRYALCFARISTAWKRVGPLDRSTQPDTTRHDSIESETKPNAARFLPRLPELCSALRTNSVDASPHDATCSRNLPVRYMSA